jgi:hypothetical protein
VHRTGFEPMFQRWQRRVLDHLDQRCKMVGEDRIELSPRVPKTRMLSLHHTPIHKNGGTERTRTVIGLVDDQVPHLSATVPNLGGSKRLELSTAAVTVRCSTN